MSYQVLARKWRPNNFNEVVGQQHILQALINALEQQRLHHAYLFSGTRGVGKTSIARLLAKCLNCEVGVTSIPCGECQSCKEIEQGRFVDLIEIDAASRTKVEDTREILDNVQYKPTRGRYKVYLIDEVHMLSRSSFNALLKTLEEPPEHVKFLFATTETQKLPVTILSRCLQFNLKALSPRQITGQLNHILTHEQIGFDEGALSLLAQSANGSMRDALSLTDQAISHGNGKLEQCIVSEMLGTIDIDYSIDLVKLALIGDSQSLFELVSSISELAPDFDVLLSQMIQNIHFSSMEKVVPNSARLAKRPRKIIELIEFDSEVLQLFYSILIQGRQELPWASDPQSGFEMVLLRLLAFKPQDLSTKPFNENNPTKLADLIEDDTSDFNEPDDKFFKSLESEQASLIAIAKNLVNEDTKEISVKAQEQVSTAQVQNTTSKSVNPLTSNKDLVVNPDLPELLPKSDSSTDIIKPPVVQSDFTQEELLNMSMALANEDEESGYHDDSTINAPNFHQPALIDNQVTPSTDINAFLKAKNALKNQRDEKGFDTPKKSQKVVEPSLIPKQEQLPQVHSTSINKKIDSLPIVDSKNLIQLTADIPVAPIIESQETQLLVDDPALLLLPNSDDPWTLKIESMNLGGRLRQLAIHSTYEQVDNIITLLLASEHAHLNADTAVNAMTKKLSLLLESPIELIIQVGESEEQTPYEIAQELHQHRLVLASERIKQDISVITFIEQFNANLIDESIKYRTIKAIS